MRKIYLLLVVFMLSMMGMVNAVNAGEVKWQSYSSNVFDQAKKQHKLVLLYGMSPWCHWCQKMDSNTWSDSGVAQLVNSHFIPVSVDVNDNAALAKSYGMKGTPTLVILNSNRQVVKTLYGFSEPYDLVNNLTAVVNQ